MTMYNYISKIESDFIEETVPTIIKTSETLKEAIDRSVAYHDMWIFHRSTFGLDEVVTEMWNEIWSKYNMGGC